MIGVNLVGAGVRRAGADHRERHVVQPDVLHRSNAIAIEFGKQLLCLVVQVIRGLTIHRFAYALMQRIVGVAKFQFRLVSGACADFSRRRGS